MKDSRIFQTALVRRILSSDLAMLVLLALGWVLIFIPINEQYGFHRDELAFVENARHLDWGYIEYPPLTPLIARAALELFGTSLVGLRLFASLAIGAVLVLVGLMARELGGSRRAQIIAALAAVSAPIALSHAAMFSYETFDYLWWVLMAYCLLRLLKTGDARWWLGIGAAIGLGMMTKYTMVFGVISLAAGVLFTPARRYLRSRWVWAGAALAVLICLPNLLWQVRHNFISLDFLTSIHSRDVRIGRTSTLQFLLGQLYICASGAAIILWINGLRFYLLSPTGKAYRPLAWMYLVPLGLFVILQGRFYYLAPAYPMLIAAGAALGASVKNITPQTPLQQREDRPVFEKERFSMPAPSRARVFFSGLGSIVTWLIVVGLVNAALTLPLMPVGSGLYKVASSTNTELAEQVGWPELVQEVARIYTALPESDRAQAGILTGNYGEAGAVNLYGPSYGLPKAISGINSLWLRGYGNPAPRVVIALGFSRDRIGTFFATCELAGHTPNPYTIENEETRDHPDIYLCRNPMMDWEEIWRRLQSFG
jgi:4-amino-4-deoxy-L-arabinose transferase-like glycosyltransferase